MTFNTGNAKGSDHCFIGDLGIMWGNTHLTGCIGEIIGFYRSLTDKETSYIRIPIFDEEMDLAFYFSSKLYSRSLFL